MLLKEKGGEMQTYLKQFRLKKGLTQADVAKQIGISVRQYQRVENGESFLTKDKLNKLEDLFGIPQRVLLAKDVKEIPDFYQHYFSFLSTDFVN